MLSLLLACVSYELRRLATDILTGIVKRGGSSIAISWAESVVMRRPTDKNNLRAAAGWGSAGGTSERSSLLTEIGKVTRTSRMVLGQHPTACAILRIRAFLPLLVDASLPCLCLKGVRFAVFKSAMMRHLTICMYIFVFAVAVHAFTRPLWFGYNLVFDRFRLCSTVPGQARLPTPLPRRLQRTGRVNFLPSGSPDRPVFSLLCCG